MKYKGSVALLGGKWGTSPRYELQRGFIISSQGALSWQGKTHSISEVGTSKQGTWQGSESYSSSSGSNCLQCAQSQDRSDVLFSPHFLQLQWLAHLTPTTPARQVLTEFTTPLPRLFKEKILWKETMLKKLQSKNYNSRLNLDCITITFTSAFYCPFKWILVVSVVFSSLHFSDCLVLVLTFKISGFLFVQFVRGL